MDIKHMKAFCKVCYVPYFLLVYVLEYDYYLAYLFITIALVLKRGYYVQCIINANIYVVYVQLMNLLIVLVESVAILSFKNRINQEGSHLVAFWRIIIDLPSLFL